MGMALSAARIGALCAIGASFGFTINDTAVKVLSGDYALHQIILIRATIAFTLMVAVLMPLTGGWRQMRTRRPVLHLVRGGLLVLANMFFFLSLSVMPIGEATAIFFVGPLIIAVFSVVFLGEYVGPRRWAAIGVGLAGVVIMIRPGTEAFTPVALLPLLSAAGYAGMHTMTRRMGITESAVTMAFYMQVAFISVSLAVGLTLGHGRLDPGDGGPVSFLTRAWVWPAPEDWLVLAVAGFGSATGGVLIAQAYRKCEAALIAPLEYVALPMAILWGLLVFGEWPDAVAWTGITLIIGAGLYMIWCETRAG